MRLIIAVALALAVLFLWVRLRATTRPIPAQEPDDVQPWDERTYTLVSGSETFTVHVPPPASWTI